MNAFPLIHLLLLPLFCLPSQYSPPWPSTHPILKWYNNNKYD
jgi:hypothetical protein